MGVSHPPESHRDRARAMRAESMYFEEIGEALGISRQGAQYLCRGDGSAEVRVVLPGDLLAHLDAMRGEEMTRPAAVVAIVKRFFC